MACRRLEWDSRDDRCVIAATEPMVAQAEKIVEQARGQGLPVAMVMHDRDNKFTKSFDA